METDGSSLLELQMEEANMLDEVQLSKSHMSTQDECPEHVEVLMGDNQHTSISCITSSAMDFEFTNSDLVNGGEFSIDNHAMFGISEGDIEVERSECDDFFQDSSCFNNDTSKSDEILISNSLTVLSDNDSGISSKDAGLRLQIIPLDSLQYVSTVQTNKGLHILAVPADITVNHIQQQYLKTITDSFKTASSCSTLHENTTPVVARQTLTLPSSTNNCSTTTTTNIGNKVNFNTNINKTGQIHQSISEKLRNRSNNAHIFQNHSSSNTQMVSLLNNALCKKSTENNGLHGDRPFRKQAGSVTLTIPLAMDRQKTKYRTSLPMKKAKTHISNIASFSVKTSNVANRKTNTSTCSSVKTIQNVNDSSNQGSAPKQNHVEFQCKSAVNDKKTTSNKQMDKKPSEVFCCAECPAKYSKKGHLNNHMLVHRQITKFNNLTVISAESLDVEHATTDPSTMDRTEATSDKEENKELEKSEMGYVNGKGSNEGLVLNCEVCDMTFKTRGNLTRHQLTHSSKTKVSIKSLY